MISIVQTASVNDLLQILELQKQNLLKSLTSFEVSEFGFLSVEHTIDQLSFICNIHPAIVIKDNEQVIGYALINTRESCAFIPVMAQLFEIFDTLIFNGRRVSDYRYFDLGQVCIHKEYRGRGLFSLLYTAVKEITSKQFELMIAEVAERNKRSTRAHEQFGLKTIHKYEEGGETWQVMAMELRN